MSERPADIRIEDLVEPVLPDEIAAMVPDLEPLADAIQWTEGELLDQAAQQCGLDDMGDDLHVEPLAVLLPAVANNERLSVLGRLAMWNTLLGFAKQKMLVTDLLRRHPEIHEIEIRRPIVIAGQARTGTTHLHNLMSSDAGLRSLPYWEACEPVPPLAEQGVDHEVDPRWTRTSEQLDQLNMVLPHFRRMHDMYTDHVHEEISLLGVGFGGMTFETMFRSTEWRDWYLASDQTPQYEFMKTVLKVLTFLRGGERWLLKSPQHVEQFGPLMSVFPDATVVITHRDPVSVTASGITMMAYTARMSEKPEWVRGVGTYWVDRFERMFRGFVAGRDLVPEAQSLDVRFDEFMADDVAMVERIYELADQPFGDDVKSGMDAFMVKNPRGKHGRVAYDLTDFGVDRSERRAALQFYVDRFGVTIEGD